MQLKKSLPIKKEVAQQRFSAQDLFRQGKLHLADQKKAIPLVMEQSKNR